jgi:hypothetical protein
LKLIVDCCFLIVDLLIVAIEDNEVYVLSYLIFALKNKSCERGYLITTASARR